MSQRASRNWRVRNWRVRTKLIAVFALPTIAAVVLAALRVQDGLANIEVFERAQHRIELAEKVAVTVDQLQAEREEMAAWIAAGRPVQKSALDQQIDQTSAATSMLQEADNLVELIDDPVTSARFQQGITRLQGLDQLRISAGNSTFAPLAAQQTYLSAIDALLHVSAEFGAEVTDRGLQERQDAMTFLAEAKEYSAEQNSYLRNAAVRGEFEAAELAGITTAQSGLLGAIDRFVGAAPPDVRIDYANTVAGDEVSRRFQLQQLAMLRAEAGLPVGVNPGEVAESSATTIDRIGQVEKRLLASTSNYTAELLTAERQNLLITSLVMLGMLLLALALMYVVGRSMLRPLRSLRSSALEVAEVHLPEAVNHIIRSPENHSAATTIEPLPVNTTEEIGEVARAFDAVNAQAVRLAVEQALLREQVNGIFVNLSRRSQRLVERQLAVIDRLESEEQDPEQLSNLFELDHLATRLRRNSESLLVLSGAGLARSALKPVPVADVIGAAVSEIEQYARVDVKVSTRVAVSGVALHDLVHLLAELLDNATYFSEPNTKVDVFAIGDNQDRLLIKIIDRGIGVSEKDIEKINERLADPPEIDVSVTRRMGLYVVAKLAQRHGIQVRLERLNGAREGIVARVMVPAVLLMPANAESLLTFSDTSSPGFVRPQLTTDHVSTATQEDQPQQVSIQATTPLIRARRASVLEDEPITERMPQYQTVLSRWFTESWSSSFPRNQGQIKSNAVNDSANSGENGKTTAVGLPKRIPQAQLRPGSIEVPQSESSGSINSQSAPTFTRSADEVRSRMSNFQQGYQRGRHALKSSEDGDEE